MADAKPPFHNPFAKLKDLGSRPSSAASPSPDVPAAPAPTSRSPAPPPSVGGRAVVRMERSGRGGKEVTVIEQLAIPPADRERWLKALKAALGCGGVVEGESMVLQGDHRQRLPALLTARGVKKVTVG